MADELVTRPGALGLVTANGGYLTKHELAYYSTEPAAHPFRYESAQDAADRIPVTPSVDDYTGPARVASWTIVHDRDGAATSALFVLALPSGARTLGRITDPALLTDLVGVELADESVEVGPGSEVKLVAA